MILNDHHMLLQPNDDIISVDGALVVRRMIELRVCRCRECDDTCTYLASLPYLLCVHCNNNHSQRADPDKWSSDYLGPVTGPRRV